ncbi:hypothetical protein [Streptomyces bluensis]|uniref:hypothetical protein n=1 Tax=Streptomyces bluensis TaxID=33897 RepID=UPI00331FCF66
MTPAATTRTSTTPAAAIGRLRENTRDGDYAYYRDIAHFMASQPFEEPSPARWIEGERQARQQWRELVTARRTYLRNPG